MHRRWKLIFGTLERKKCFERLIEMQYKFLVGLFLYTLVAAEPQECTKLVVDCKGLLCLAGFAEESAPLYSTPWSLDCVSPGLHHIVVEPTAREYSSQEILLSASPQDSIHIQVDPTYTLTPIAPVVHTQRTFDYSLRVQGPAPFVIEGAQALPAHVLFLAQIHNGFRSLQNQFVWQPTIYPWTLLLGIETTLQSEAWQGTRFKVGSAGEFTWGRFAERFEFFCWSHSKDSLPLGLANGPEAMLEFHQGIYAGKWSPGLAMQASQSLYRSKKTFARAHTTANIIIDLCYQLFQSWSIQSFVLAPIYGQQAWSAGVSFQFAKVHQPLIYKVSKSTTTFRDTAWLADLHPSSSTPFHAELAQAKNPRLPHLAEWKQWIRTTSQDTACLTHESEWILPDIATQKFSIRSTAFDDNKTNSKSSCNLDENSWQALPPNPHEFANPRWWRAIFLQDSATSMK